MSSRRRRRRRRSRRGSSVSPFVLLLSFLALALVGVGGFYAYANGVRLPTSGGGATSITADRFSGAEGVVIPDTKPADFWWLRVTKIASTVDPAYLPGTTPGKQFERLNVPAALLFEADSADLSTTSINSLDSLANNVRNPGREVAVVCHASSDGSAAAGYQLSELRAESLARYLEEKVGRARGSIIRIGKGDSVPLPNVDPTSATGKALHRRCEVFVEVGR